MNNGIYYERRQIYMKSKRKIIKNIIALLLCLLMAAGTAVPAFAMDEMDDDHRKAFDSLPDEAKEMLKKGIARSGGFYNAVKDSERLDVEDRKRDEMWDPILNNLSFEELKKQQKSLQLTIDEVSEAQEIGRTAAYGELLNKYVRFKHPEFENSSIARAYDDWANLTTAFSIFQGISSVIYLVQNAVSFFQMLGIVKGEPDPSVAVMQQLGSLRSSVDEVDRKLDTIQDTLVNDFAELDMKLQQQDFNHYKDDVWAKFYTDAVVPVNNIQTEYALRVNDLLLDYIGRWQEGENKTDLRALYGRNEENGEIMQVFSGRNIKDPGKALSRCPEVSLDGIPVEYSVVVPAEYITGNMDKNIYLTSDNYIEVLKNALTKGVYQAAEKGELTAYPGFEKEWAGFTEEEKQAAAKEYSDALASALSFAAAYNAVNEKGFSSDVKNAYLNFTEWLQGIESLTSPLTAQLKMLSLSHVFEGEITADADNITYYLCMMNSNFHNFTQSVLAMSKSQSEEQKLEVSNAYYLSEITMTMDYTNFITGNPNYCYVTGSVLEYKNTTLESTMKSYHVQYDEIVWNKENENTQYAIPEGFSTTRWKLYEQGSSDSEKDNSQSDLMARTVTPKQARILYAMYETANTGTSFSEYLVDNSVAASTEQITKSGIITSFATENLDLNKESVDMTCYLPSGHGTYAYTPGKVYTVKSSVAADLNKESNFVLHDKATGGLLDLTTGKFNENAPLEYRVYYHGTNTDSAGKENHVHRLIAFTTAEFSSRETFLEAYNSSELSNLGKEWYRHDSGRTDSVFTSNKYGMLVSSEVSTYTFSKATKTIGSKFFGDTVDIRKLVLEGTPESIADDAFENVGTSYSRCLLQTPFITGSLLSKWHGGYFGNTYITIEKNDGSGEKESIVAVNGAPVSSVVCTFTAPDNATFGGWSFYPNGAAAGTEESVYTGVTLYARWKYDHEHDFEVTGEAAAATCTEAGHTEEKTCKICGYKDVKVIPATDHTCNFTKSGNNYIAKCTVCDYEATLYPKDIGYHTVWSENKSNEDVKYVSGNSSDGITYINRDGVYVIETKTAPYAFLDFSRQTIEVADKVSAAVCLAGVNITAGMEGIPGINIGKADVHLTLSGENKVTSDCADPFVCEGNLMVDGAGSLIITTDGYHIPINCTGENTVINGGCINAKGGFTFSIKVNGDKTNGKLVITQNASVRTDYGIDTVPVNENGEKVYLLKIPNNFLYTITVDGKDLPDWTTLRSERMAFIYITAGDHEILVGGQPFAFTPFEDESDYFEKQYGDLIVINPTGDPYAVSYVVGSSGPNVLLIQRSVPLTIKNADPDKASKTFLYIQPYVDADITLAGVNIDLSYTIGSSPIQNSAGKYTAGNAKITLAEGTENILIGGYSGISMEGIGGSLTIDGEGTLTVKGSGNSAAIGSNVNTAAGKITINGGTIYASVEDSEAAAIGSGRIRSTANISTGYAVNNITINGGKVYATSDKAPAVGAGVCEQDLPVNNITVNGGMLIAKSNAGECAIGGDNAKEVVINGGVVTAESTSGDSIRAGKVIIENTASVKSPRITDPVNGFGKSVSLNVIPIDPAYDIFMNGKGYKCIGHNGEDKIYLYLAEGEKIEKTPHIEFEESDRGIVTCLPDFPKAGEEVTPIAGVYEGYSFVGFEITPDVELKDGNFTMPNGTVTIKGIFARVGTVTLTESEHGRVMPSRSLVSSGEKVTLRALPDEGYELDTLTVTPATLEADGMSFIMPEEDVTITCTFKKKVNKVTWNIDGEKTEEDVVFGSEIIKPEDPKKEGYNFMGWTPVIPETMPDANLEFYAVFEPITYTAKFIADGVEIGKVEYNLSMSKLDEPAVPKKEGYTEKWEEYTLTAGGITVKAVYTPIEYTARFIANGEVIDTVTYTVETLALDEPDVPAKTGYTGRWSNYDLRPGGITIKAVYSAETAHQHSFETEYSNNEAAHWFASTCGHDIVSSLAAHTFGEGVVKGDVTEYTCTVCEYVKTVSNSESGKTDELELSIIAAKDAIDKAAADGSEDTLKYAGEAKEEIEKLTSISAVNEKLVAALKAINDMKTEEAAAEAIDTLDSVTASTSKGQSIVRMAKLLISEAGSPEAINAILTDALTKLEAEESAEAGVTLAKTDAKDAISAMAGEKQSDEMKSIIADIEAVIDAAQTADQVAAALELGEAAVQMQLNKEAADASLEEAEASLADAEKALTEAQNALKEKTDALKEAEDKLEEANKALEQAKKDLETAEGDIEAKTKALEEADKNLAAVQKELDETKSALDEKTEALLEAKANLTAANKALEKANGQVQALTDDLKEVNDELTETKSALDTANAQIDTLTGELQKANEELNQTKTALNEAKESLENAKTEKKNLEEQLTAKETELENLKKSASAKDEEIAALQKAVADLEAAVKSKDDEINEKSNEITGLKKSITELENTIKEKEDEISENKNTISNLEKTISNLEALAQAKETEVAEKTKEIKKLENNVEDLEDEISKAQENIEEKTSQVKELTEKLEEAQAEIEELKGGPSRHEDDTCPKCGENHQDNFWGQIVCFFNRIGNFFRDLFQKLF